ncbi:hypothetical protein IFR04_014545 [Cadophora malorum]|uniref:Uncharacterized protein n=1 Tax=Cadophora malorum TaxID=108018 RepID=A0A8H7T4Z1_9HELO|nr:hypothetical protein IFR04_014545 [Cadophora malorum]
MFAIALTLLALGGLSLGAPTQEPLNTPVEIKDSPEFPLPPPLPFNGTIPGVDYDLIAKLKTSPNAITRIALLKDSDFAFDFISPPNIPGIELRARWVQHAAHASLCYRHNTWGMAVSPQGSLHLEFNPDCTDMIFIAAFNSADPGANFPAETLFQLDDNFAGLALGLEFLPGADIDRFHHLVPATLAHGVDSCLRRCGIKKNEL